VQVSEWKIREGGTQDVPVPDHRRPFLGVCRLALDFVAPGGGVG
jgi:hypothetical protein